MPILGGGSSVRAGTVQTWASANIPAGWLKCNGAAISRTLYAALFNEIGTTYGVGDGSTTFNVPDMRGEFLRGLDDGRGVDASRTLGSSQSDSFASHNHGGMYAISSLSGNVYGYQSWTDGPFTWPNSATTSARSTGSTGSTETRPRNRAMHFIIKF